MTLCTYCGEMVGNDAKITIEHMNISCHPSCFKVTISAHTKDWFFPDTSFVWHNMLDVFELVCEMLHCCTMTMCFTENIYRISFSSHPSVVFAVNQWEIYSTTCFSIVGRSTVRAATPMCYKEICYTALPQQYI